MTREPHTTRKRRVQLHERGPNKLGNVDNDRTARQQYGGQYWVPAARHNANGHSPNQIALLEQQQDFVLPRPQSLD
jgi:hypothetical protein